MHVADQQLTLKIVRPECQQPRQLFSLMVLICEDLGNSCIRCQLLYTLQADVMQRKASLLMNLAKDVHR